MSESDSYFDPADIALLAETDESHYWHRARRRLLLDYIPSGRVLDVGCGPGTVTTYFNRNGRTVDYAEVHAEGLAHARRLAGELDREFIRYDVTIETLPSGYSCVTLLDVIEHLPDDVGALRNVRAGIEPGGCLIVTVPAFPMLWSRFDEIAKHKRRYRVGTLRDAVEAAGFQVEKIGYFFAPLFVASSLVQLTRRVRKPETDQLAALAEARTSPWLSRVMVGVLALERPIVRYARLPFGTSVLCVARAA